MGYRSAPRTPLHNIGSQYSGTCRSENGTAPPLQVRATAPAVWRRPSCRRGRRVSAGRADHPVAPCRGAIETQHPHEKIELRRTTGVRRDWTEANYYDVVSSFSL